MYIVYSPIVSYKSTISETTSTRLNEYTIEPKSNYYLWVPYPHVLSSKGVSGLVMDEVLLPLPTSSATDQSVC